MSNIKDKTKNKRRFHRALRRFIIYLILLGAALILGGFVAFARHVANPNLPPPDLDADGIVVWTGKGGGRLEAGGKLLAQDRGERLLISGVNKNTSRDDVITLIGLTPAQSECCLDLDYAAINTLTNAAETSAWAKALGYEHIILVTSDYHMPRAAVELSIATEDLRITPYPVPTQVDGKWWSDPVLFRRLATEYGKLLLTYAREPRGR